MSSRPTIDRCLRQRMADAIATLEFEQGMRWPSGVKIRLEVARLAMIRAGKMIYEVEKLLSGEAGPDEFIKEIDGLD